ncbi:hypothetical protein BCR35DRAFT_309939 [Leucosporidium creatinivorum]|uniref:Uncharacterized protein n=1 Tax=Leucosporidium creatinivorum TaxID=106004 RepID=A0A1Y2D9N2_9BASI|nr:hypothetical protein BCR35DRAFT_309939 [Leucosporidium creatinivorum]
MQSSHSPYTSVYPSSGAHQLEAEEELQPEPVDYSSYGSQHYSTYPQSHDPYNQHSLFDHQQADNDALGASRVGEPSAVAGAGEGWLPNSFSPFDPAGASQYHQPTWEQLQTAANGDSGSRSVTFPTCDGDVSAGNDGFLASGMTMTSNGLQLEDLGHRWEAGEHRGRPAESAVGSSALGLGFGGTPGLYDGQPPTYLPPHFVPSTTPANDSTSQPPTKRRSSRPSSSSSSEHPSPYLPTSTHHPSWLNMSPRTSHISHSHQEQFPAPQPRHWAAQAGGAALYHLPRSASLPHLFDYGQSFTGITQSYPSPGLSSPYASLQHSPVTTSNSSLNSPLPEPAPILSPRDQTIPFHSPATSIANRLALSKLSNLSTPSSPPKPKTKPITPLVDASSTLATLARANRIKFGIVDASTNSTRKPTITIKQPRAVSARRNLSEEDAFCFLCQSKIGRVILRGTEAQRSVEWHSGLECLQCIPAEEKGEEDDGGSGEEGSEVLRYETTFSAGLDKLEGIELEMEDTRPPAGKTKPVAKRKREGVEKEFVACDVCTRDVARGQLLKVADDSPVDFYVELVCETCHERYQRCTDCGGGGGPRLGVGRWRCKELFEDGRLTCKLSHVRLGTPSETLYDIWAVKDLPSEEVEEMFTACRELFQSTYLGILAIPDMLEAPEPLARTYQEVEKLAVDSFTMFEDYLRKDVEETEHRRRYLAIRWSSSSPKRKGSAASATLNLDVEAQRLPSKLVRSDKTLAGYVIGELDLRLGSAFIPLSMPKGTGDSYDAATALQQVMLRRMQIDLDATNAQRASQKLSAYPDLNEVWSIQMYKKESRILNRLETQRGFLPLKEYLDKIPSNLTDRSHFPPEREIFLPSEFLVGWRIYARRFGREEDLTIKSAKVRRKSGAAKGRARKKAAEGGDSEEEN